MKLLALIICSILLAVLIAAYGGINSGQLTLILPGWFIQTSLNFFIVALVILFTLLYYLLRLLSGLYSIPQGISRWRQHRAQRRDSNNLRQGLQALLSKDWHKAETTFSQGAQHSTAQTINHLAAAQAAQQLGDIVKRDQHLDAAIQDNQSQDQSSDLLPIQIKTQLQLQQGQTEEALDTLIELHKKTPKSPQITQMLLQAYMTLEDWKMVLQLLSRSKKHTLSLDTIQSARHMAHSQILKNTGTKIHQGQAEPELLHKSWIAIPKAIRLSNEILAIYCTEKLRYPTAATTADCEPLLRRALKRHWDSDLIRLYSLLSDTDTVAQLKFAESCLEQHKDDPALLYTLGRLSEKNELWGKAKAYLQECLLLQELPEIHQQLAGVLQQLGEHESATSHYQQGLQLAISSARTAPQSAANSKGSE